MGYLIYYAIGIVVIMSIHWPADPISGRWDWTWRDVGFVFVWPWPLIAYLCDRWHFRGYICGDTWRHARVYDWLEDHNDEFMCAVLGFMFGVICQHFNWLWL